MEIINLLNSFDLEVIDCVIVNDNEVKVSLELYDDSDKLFYVEISEKFEDVYQISKIIDKSIKILEAKIKIYLINYILTGKYPMYSTDKLILNSVKELNNLYNIIDPES